MTLLVVDKFQDSVYVFGDGRITSDMALVSDTYRKVVDLPNGVIVGFVGSVGALEAGIELMSKNELDMQNLYKIAGQGSLLVIDRYELIEYEFNDGTDENNKNPNNICYYPHNGVIAFGSDTDSFRAVYKALKIDQSTTEKQYLHRIKEAYKIVSSIQLSIGQLFTTNVIR